MIISWEFRYPAEDATMPLMNDQPPREGPRLRPLTRRDLTPEQAGVWSVVVNGRRGTGQPPESLAGPFDAWLRRPAAGHPAAVLGERLRFESSLPRDVLELAVVTVGARWQAQFEFWAHSRMASRHGIDPAVLEALREGREPVLSSPVHQAAHRFVADLVTDGHVADDVYHSAVDALSEERVVELVMLVGYYSLVCFTLNAFRVPLPAGTEPVAFGRPHGPDRTES
jgi:4-carboxymuconolactone decarboxylase